MILVNAYPGDAGLDRERSQDGHTDRPYVVFEKCDLR